MRATLLLTAALLAAALAGCTSAGKAMTARDGLAEAMDTAAKWADGKDPQLVAAAAIEPFRHATYDSPDGRDHAEYETRLDSAPGDGRAPGWLYGLRAGDRCITVVLAAGLGVLADGYQTCAKGQQEMDALGSWSIDSDRAATLLAGNGAWPQPADNLTYTWALAAHDGHPVWAVTASSPDGNFTVGAVDADNGTVLLVRNGDDLSEDVRVFEAPPPAAASTAVHDEARAVAVTPLQPLTVTVDLQGHGGGLSFSASAAASLGAVGRVQLVLAGPSGTVDDESFSGAGGPQVLTKAFDGLGPGTYTLTLSTTVGAALNANLALDGSWSAA